MRDMVRAGSVRETLWRSRTRAVFDRYNIFSEEDVRQAAARTSAYAPRCRERRLSFTSGVEGGRKRATNEPTTSPIGRECTKGLGSFAP